MTTALLFDLDGTLIDSDPLHAAVFIEMFAERGQEIDFEFYRENIHGRLNAHIFAELFPGEDAEAMADYKEAEYRRRLKAGQEPIPGTFELLDLADRMGWGKAVVTNAPRENGEAVLEALGLTNRIDTLVIGDECARGKPDPAPYAEGLRRLGADPAASLAFEDSPPGIRSATGAGLKTIGIRSLLDDATLRDAGASLTIKNYADPHLAPHIEKLKG
ncbi:HAD family hydrolase [Tropicimonas isoalkanivorans]|uniref:Haloacid dehalogenase superfamily, subfamily IA, variant 3 with third motif having DD or ED n=1 Tax=Tropicimonas isoalkanivorans TaxID=441112 RepID=A0A1I1DNY2_9RHOB|nr:HAD family phosphatase [Tropicimonas isoalkanivorans]SFB76126.1 haloacid dehalogenase superfamily, subfamily IA, variant 3 with third motif having DD or ED [Tropicimonas isoalkanivorans]